MKNGVKNVLGLFLAIGILIYLIWYAGGVLRPIDGDITLAAIDAFHSMPEESIEVIAYGSSHTWTGLNVMEMYKEYGIGAYNYGCNWQRINTTSLFFQDSLRTQSPKVILIETFLINDLAMDTDINGEIYYTKEISAFEAKDAYLKQCFGDNIERYLSYYIPFAAFHMNWNHLQKESFLGIPYETQKYFCHTMGQLTIDDIVPIQIGDCSTFEQKELSDDAKKVLDQIVQICNENDIQIVFYTAPFQGEYYYFDALNKYAEENNCKYINLFEKLDEAGIDESTDFYNAGHLNSSGAKKVADYLGRYLTERYQITDMRQVHGNLWEANLEHE